jgi:hypothetical protein
MTVSSTVRRRASTAWKSIGLALARPWFWIFEMRSSNLQYRGSGQFVDIERQRHTEYETGVVAALISVLPSVGYLSALCCVLVIDGVSWPAILVSLFLLGSIQIIGEVDVEKLAGGNS